MTAVGERCPVCGSRELLAPITPERAAANARLLEAEVAAYEEAHADDEEPAA